MREGLVPQGVSDAVTDYTIDWPEPFGLVMAEAMACGTPVIAFRRGSVDEVVVDGVTGIVCRSCTGEEMVQAVRQVEKLERAACRHHVEENFSSAVMAERYEAVCRRVVAEARGETVGVPFEEGFRLRMPPPPRPRQGGGLGKGKAEPTAWGGEGRAQ